MLSHALLPPTGSRVKARAVLKCQLESSDAGSIYTTEIGTRLAASLRRAGCYTGPAPTRPGPPWKPLSLLCSYLPRQHALCPLADSTGRSKTGGFQENKTKRENQLVKAENPMVLAGLVSAALSAVISLAPRAECSRSRRLPG